MTEAHQPNSGRSMFLIPAGLALLLVGLAAMLFAFGQHMETRARAMKSWPSTLGTISGSGLQDRRQADGYVYHTLDTGIRYSVDGHTYSFTTSEYVGRSLSQSHTDGASVVDHANDSVRVVYNPEKPADAVLKLDDPPSTLLKCLGGLLAAVSLPLWYLSARWFRSNRQATP